MRTDNTRDERAKRAREKKLATGLVSRALYLPAEVITELQAAFPGPAGGIAWSKVADAALLTARKRADHAAHQRDRTRTTREADGLSENAKRCRRYRERKRAAAAGS